MSWMQYNKRDIQVDVRDAKGWIFLGVFIYIVWFSWREILCGLLLKSGKLN